MVAAASNNNNSNENSGLQGSRRIRCTLRRAVQQVVRVLTTVRVWPFYCHAGDHLKTYELTRRSKLQGWKAHSHWCVLLCALFTDESPPNRTNENQPSNVFKKPENVSFPIVEKTNANSHLPAVSVSHSADHAVVDGKECGTRSCSWLEVVWEETPSCSRELWSGRCGWVWGEEADVHALGMWWRGSCVSLCLGQGEQETSCDLRALQKNSPAWSQSQLQVQDFYLHIEAAVIFALFSTFGILNTQRSDHSQLDKLLFATHLCWHRFGFLFIYLFAFIFVCCCVFFFILKI